MSKEKKEDNSTCINCFGTKNLVPITKKNYGCENCFPDVTPCDECGLWVKERLHNCNNKHDLCEQCFENCRIKCVLDDPLRADEVYFRMGFNHYTTLLTEMPNIE